MLRQPSSDSFTDPQFIFMQRPVIKEVSGIHGEITSIIKHYGCALPDGCT